jgi:signal transduction histidine kinase
MGLCVEPLPVRLDPAGLDAAILELVANARAALLSPGTILIRAKRIGTRALLIVADTGRGMSEAELARALRGCDAPSATGTGLGRVRGFAWSARARLRIRSREGRGTVVSLNLPLVLKLASVEPAVPPVRRNHSAEETGHEKRQPVTA